MSLMPDSMLTCRSRGTPAKAPSRDYFLWVHGDMNSKRDIIYGTPVWEFLRVEGFTAVPKDYAVFLALLQLVPDWVL